VGIGNGEDGGVSAVVSEGVIEGLSGDGVAIIAKVPSVGKVITWVGGCGTEGGNCTFSQI